MMGESLIQDALGKASRWRSPLIWKSSGAAACLIIGLALWGLYSRPQKHAIATLISSEHAAWESSSPTMPGLELHRGLLKLVAGMATIRFESGAQVILEAPAQLILESTMRAKLVAGSVVVHVPESAIGFIIDTPNGYAVDYGTEFAVKFDEKMRQSTFQVVSGEISVAHARTDQAVRLTDDQLLVATHDALLQPQLARIETSLVSKERNALRFSTSHETSVIRHNYRERFLYPEFLMAKTGRNKVDGFASFDEFDDFDRRALFSFDLTAADISAIQSAQVRLNLVPSGIGYATYLPEANTFAIYGVVDEAAEEWSDELRWEDAPRLEQCKLLGTFDVPRGLQTGSFTLGNATLVSFLKSDSNARVTFVLVRLTGEKKSQGLVHTFASSQHAEASGPSLEIRVPPKPEPLNQESL
jgi:hypothetical protein